MDNISTGSLALVLAAVFALALPMMFPTALPMAFPAVLLLTPFVLVRRAQTALLFLFLKREPLRTLALPDVFCWARARTLGLRESARPANPGAKLASRTRSRRDVVL